MIKGSLFPLEFLKEDINAEELWVELQEETIQKFKDTLVDIFQKFPTDGNPNEPTTERDLIDPVIEALGWSDYLTQQTTSKKGRSDIPDYLLFPDSESKNKANKEKSQANRFKFGTAILEAKAWGVPLDRKSSKNEDDQRIPSNQILRYMSHADVQSDRKIKWAILTNGRLWRLYFQNAKSRSEDFIEFDLPKVFGFPGYDPDLFESQLSKEQDWVKVFYLLFHSNAFNISTTQNETFHGSILSKSRFWEKQVAKDLSNVVFETVFPELVKAICAHDPEAPVPPDSKYLSEVRDAALTLLYRLLFILYAEDRNLLPVTNEKYDDYGLRKRVRIDIAERLDAQDTFSSTQDDYFRKTSNIFKSIDRGDSSIGLPPYNGGLFNRELSPILNRTEIPDSKFAPLLDGLSRIDEDGNRKWVNYRDLSVQQLGSIYERLLEFELSLDEDNQIQVLPNIFARKTTGSFYTHEDLVQLIIDKTIGPLIEEKLIRFQESVKELGKKRRPKKEKIKELERYDPSASILDLKICDPAMGSGHFLVSLVDYLADKILESLAESEEAVTWADKENPYQSPLISRIQDIRSRILSQVNEQGWTIDEDQLDDRHIIRRMILKRCVYGVDKNPMAVELAKVTLWLHTFTVGAPLSFLDHHLRCGDSLFGEFIFDVEEYLRERSSLLINNEVIKARSAAQGMTKIQEMTDAEISEVKESALAFSEVEKATQRLDRFVAVVHAFHWLAFEKREYRTAINYILDGFDLFNLAVGEEKLSKTASPVVKEMWGKAEDLIREERFFHWEIGFPEVWDNWESPQPAGGFDAVIGNPPWDRIKMQEVEWFAARKPEIALCERASDRKKKIQKLKKDNDPLWQDYLKASNRAEGTSAMARKGGQYPLLSVGDINIYSLFVERAHRLVSKTGLVGFLTPSGIASDKSASEFFKSISTSGRLAGLFDFENKKVFFPDIHASFKFCAYIAGGAERTFPETQMAFFLHATEEINDQERCFPMSPQDFNRVNPNTGTAPIFRTRRDAEITRRIYEKFPVLNHHEKGKVWPVKYLRMFDMTNDSDKFKTREELESKGFYPIEGNKLKKGEEECVPLYEGKMVQAYDHRAASVIVNKMNLNRPAQPKATEIQEYKNPSFFPSPQFLVNSKEIRGIKNINWFLAFKSITAPTNSRTMITSILPYSGIGNSMGIVFPESQQTEKGIQRDQCIYAVQLILVNLNSFALDFILRQKVQGQNLNWYIVEQLPLIPVELFSTKFGKLSAREIIHEEVLRLTYTAWDLKDFAKDMGYEGEPFVWDEEDRLHQKARLDALFFLLYELSEEDADYILETFPIVKREDESRYGKFRTKELILAYMRAFKAGDTDSRINV